MTRFNRFDHDDAAQAWKEAEVFQANVTDRDLVILSRVTGDFSCNQPSNLSRKTFNEVLVRVRNLTLDAMKANPELVRRVEAERAEAGRAWQQKLDDEKAARRFAIERNNQFGRSGALLAYQLGLRDRLGMPYIGKKKAEKLGLVEG
jgi:hypothetical protein